MRGSLLVAGTTSDAGKSVVTTGLCRLLHRRDVLVAPFKAQNMSNNSMVVTGPDGQGAEIGRAQWIQAIAAGATPEVAMNPVLLKPGSDRRSHVVVNGRPAGTISSAEFAGDRRALADAAFAAYADLAARYDVVIAEGAGSPTEINLRASDYVNMGFARHADIPVIVVGDIDRGGLYAALHGTVALLEPADQALLAGFVINKFRGDETLLAPANEAITRVTGRPVLGVLPWSPDVWLDSEDGLDVAARRASAEDQIRVAVVRLPRISNFTDVDALGLEPDVDLRFVSDPRDLRDADLVVLPGTRATISDLAWLRARGLDAAIVDHAAAGRPVVGICGGFQMLGGVIDDGAGVEGSPQRVRGLDLVDVMTEFRAEKILRLHDPGYEIHHGHMSVDELWTGPLRGTMLHGRLEDDAVRADVLALARPGRAPSGVSFAAAREARLDRLADLVEQHCDVDAVVRLIEDGAPAGLPVVAPGGVA